MALSDCPKCWDTPCTCGHYYRNYSEEAKAKAASTILGNTKVYTKEDMWKAYVQGAEDNGPFTEQYYRPEENLKEEFNEWLQNR